MTKNRHNKKVYQRKIYSLVEKKVIRNPDNGSLYVENSPHVRIDGKMYYGNKAIKYLVDRDDGVVIDKAEELN